MLSGEGNAAERWKTTIGLIRKKLGALHVQHTFSSILTLSIVSASQDAGGYAIFRENNLELLLGYRLNELFYIGMPAVWTDGRSVGVRSRDYQIFSDG